MIEILADGSVRWRLSDVAAEEMQLIVPRAAMTRVGVRYETECTVQLQGGLTFESKLLPVVETRGGRLSIRWPEMRDALKLRGGETVRLWEGHSGTKLQLILHVTAPLQPQVRKYIMISPLFVASGHFVQNILPPCQTIVLLHVPADHCMLSIAKHSERGGRCGNVDFQAPF